MQLKEHLLIEFLQHLREQDLQQNPQINTAKNSQHLNGAINIYKKQLIIQVQHVSDLLHKLQQHF